MWREIGTWHLLPVIEERKKRSKVCFTQLIIKLLIVNRCLNCVFRANDKNEAGMHNACVSRTCTQSNVRRRGHHRGMDDSTADGCVFWRIARYCNTPARQDRFTDEEKRSESSCGEFLESYKWFRRQVEWIWSCETWSRMNCNNGRFEQFNDPDKSLCTLTSWKLIESLKQICRSSQVNLFNQEPRWRTREGDNDTETKSQLLTVSW